MIIAPRNKTIQTVVVSDNNNPIFYQTIESYLYCVDLEYAPPIVLEIFDLDKGVISDSFDYIGRSVVQLGDASYYYKKEDVPKPKWHPIKFGFHKDEPEMGQILVSFSILDPGVNFKIPIEEIRLGPELEEYEITINVLGLRELQSPGILPIRKAFINFMLRSLLPPSKAHAIDNIQTQPSATGWNPTIPTVIKFIVYLPCDPLYWPSLTCGVYDYIFKGLSQPQIGNFIIPIGGLQHLQNEMFEEVDERTQAIIRVLEDKIDNQVELKRKLEEQRKIIEQQKEREENLLKLK